MTTRPPHLLAAVQPALAGAAIAFVTTLLAAAGIGLVVAGGTFFAVRETSTVRAILAAVAAFGVVGAAGIAIAPTRALAGGLTAALARTPIGQEIAAWLVARLPDPDVRLPVAELEGRLVELVDRALADDHAGFVKRRLRSRLVGNIRAITVAEARDRVDPSGTLSPRSLATHLGPKLDDALRDRVADPARMAVIVASGVALAIVIAIVVAARTV